MSRLRHNRVSSEACSTASQFSMSEGWRESHSRRATTSGMVFMPTTKHGHSRKGIHSPEYYAWHNMKRRCYSANNSAYKYYGARGIVVCERWLSSFKNFLDDMGPRPSGFSLDRKDNDGNYCPENCFWADSKTQNNNRRSNHLVTIDGLTLPLGMMAAKLGISRGALSYRIAHGLLNTHHPTVQHYQELI